MKNIGQRASIGALILIGLGASVTGAQAAVVNLSYSTTAGGTSGAGVGTILPVPGAHTFGNTLPSLSTPVSGSAYEFYDDYVFTINAATTQILTSSINLGSFLGLNNFQARLFNLATYPNLPLLQPATPGTLLQAWSTQLNAGGASGLYAVINPIQLSAGTYVLEIRGNVSGQFGGAYSGVVNLAPVPLPAALPLMLMGLGSLGAAMRRKAV